MEYWYYLLCLYIATGLQILETNHFWKIRDTTFCIISQENGVVSQYHYYLKKEAQESRELNSTVKGKISVWASHSSKGGFVAGSYAKG